MPKATKKDNYISVMTFKIYSSIFYIYLFKKSFGSITLIIEFVKSDGFLVII